MDKPTPSLSTSSDGEREIDAEDELRVEIERLREICEKWQKEMGHSTHTKQLISLAAALALSTLVARIGR